MNYGEITSEIFVKVDPEKRQNRPFLKVQPYGFSGKLFKTELTDFHSTNLFISRVNQYDVKFNLSEEPLSQSNGQIDNLPNAFLEVLPLFHLQAVFQPLYIPSSPGGKIARLSFDLQNPSLEISSDFIASSKISKVPIKEVYLAGDMFYASGKDIPAFNQSFFDKRYKSLNSKVAQTENAFVNLQYFEKEGKSIAGFGLLGKLIN